MTTVLPVPPPSLATVVDRLIARGVLPAERVAGSLEAGSLRRVIEAAEVEPGAVADALAAIVGLPRADLDAMRAGESLAERFSLPYLRDHALYPYATAEGEARLAIADPTAPLELLEAAFDEPPRREVAAFEEIEALLRGDGETTAAIGEPGEAMAAAVDGDDLESLRDLASGTPVVHAVQDLFERAVEARATDIHVEPFRGALQVRIRVDGLLRPIPAPPAAMARAVVSRIKILSSLNIAERRLPQDGRARVRVGGSEIDVRVSTMPTAHGEAAILRLLERNRRLVDLDRLGLSSADRLRLDRHLEAPHGLVVVTGPTGSGKTTTIAALLGRLNRPHRKILTIEDPIEYDLPGVSQSQVKPAIGLTFATALRSFLRQDPDVIMVGEMRDTETARIGLQASLTGHLVVTTLHTNTAAAAVTRLVDMGVEPYLLASTLRLVVGQRLVRVLCVDCRTTETLDAASFDREPRAAALGLRIGDTFGRAVGCPRCGGSGYRGRMAVFEVLEVDDTIRRMIVQGAVDSEIEAAAEANGMTTMIADGVVKGRAGTTSVEEILRVTASR
jgi:general secretion pathway protein E